MILDFRSGSHTKHRIIFHFIFVPKYRRRVISKPIAIRLKNLFFEACKDNNWFIDEIEILPDHSHLIIQIKPKDSIASVAKILKGGSSRVIRQEFPKIREFLWGDNFWATGYFAESLGVKNLDSMKRYIQNQTQHHGTD